LEGRLKKPLFCKKILVSKFIREWKREVVDSSKERRGEEMRLSCSPTL
jgi:hypothetical protein